MVLDPYAWPSPTELFDDDRFGRRNYLRHLLEPPPVLFDDDAIRSLRQLIGSLSSHDERWLPIGPGPTIRNVPSGVMRVAGRVRDLQVSPDNSRVYILGGLGGVWASDDSGVNWTPLGGWCTDPTGTSMDIDYTTASGGCLLVKFGESVATDEVWVGTGETNAQSIFGEPEPGAVHRSIGILRAVGPLQTVRGDRFARPFKREANNLEGTSILRMTISPAGDEIVAATSSGVFHRTGSFVEDADWPEVAGVGPTSGDWSATDIIWTPADGTFNARLWIAVRSEDDPGLYVSTAGTAGPFTHVALPDGVDDKRLSVTATPDPRVFFVFGDGHAKKADGPPHLVWRVRATGAGGTVHRLTGVPSKIPNGAGFYNLTIAYAELDDGTGTEQPTLFLGGATVSQAAALYKCVVSGSDAAGYALNFDAVNDARPQNDETWVGRGVHADVHAVRITRTGSGDTQVDHVWVGCDGGVFLSTRGGNRATFTDCNDGLVTLEAGYVDAHPSHPSPVITGTQDNGVSKRIGVMLWERELGGDGGGVVYHPDGTGEIFGQAHNGSWRSSIDRIPAGGRVNDRPVHRRGDNDSKSRESDAALFYSGADVVTRGAQVDVALGTNRVWVGTDLDDGTFASWQNLPSGVDGRARGAINDGLDVLDSPISSCKWGDSDNLLVLTRQEVLHFVRPTSGSAWTKKTLTAPKEKNQDTIDSSSLMGFLPAVGYWSEIAPDSKIADGQWSLYVSGTGRSDRPDMDTLWWFDGIDKWIPTGLRMDPMGTSAPAYAVVCDPTNTSIVYVGTRVGVWKGTRSVDGAGLSSWNWEPMSNGLPELVVQDLAVLSDGSSKLLRAALPARGVWEFDLTGPVEPRTYVRVHPRDTRRTLPTPLAKAEDDDQIAPGNSADDSDYVWWSSPDVRVRPSPGTVYPNPLTAGGHITDGARWIFQTALHELEPTFMVSSSSRGALYKAALERFRAQHNPGVRGRIKESDWNALVGTGAQFCADPWAGLEPSEVDLAQLLYNGRANALELDSHRPGPKSVHVLVHHRDYRDLDPIDTVVTLLTREVDFTPGTSVDAAAAAWGATATNAAFKTAVQEILLNDVATPPAGWNFASTLKRRGSPRAKLDIRRPQAVTFPATLASKPFMMLAIVHSITDPIDASGALDGANVKDLVLGSSHVACTIIGSDPLAYP